VVGEKFEKLLLYDKLGGARDEWWAVGTTACLNRTLEAVGKGCSRRNHFIKFITLREDYSHKQIGSRGKSLTRLGMKGNIQTGHSKEKTRAMYLVE